MSFINGIIFDTIWKFVTQFWGWIVAGGIAVLGFLFSSTIRKYTIGVIIVAAILLATFTGGYLSNHTVYTRSCDDFRPYLTVGKPTDNALSIFRKHGLCQ